MMTAALCTSVPELVSMAIRHSSSYGGRLAAAEHCESRAAEASLAGVLQLLKPIHVTYAIPLHDGIVLVCIDPCVAATWLSY
jgi:hypothetical protein